MALRYGSVLYVEGSKGINIESLVVRKTSNDTGAVLKLVFLVDHDRPTARIGLVFFFDEGEHDFYFREKSVALIRLHLPIRVLESILSYSGYLAESVGMEESLVILSVEVRDHNTILMPFVLADSVRGSFTSLPVERSLASNRISVTVVCKDLVHVCYKEGCSVAPY